jgi:hypothetical protein
MIKEAEPYESSHSDLALIFLAQAPDVDVVEDNVLIISTEHEAIQEILPSISEARFGGNFSATRVELYGVVCRRFSLSRI